MSRAKSITGTSLVAELLGLVREDVRDARGETHLSDDLRRRLDESLTRARGRAEDVGQAAALDFVCEAIAAVAIDDSFAPGEARAAVASAAGEIGLAPENVAFSVFRRALASREYVQLAPVHAADRILSLLVEVGPAKATSLWMADGRGGTTCFVSAGRSIRNRRLRGVARAALDGAVTSTARVRVQRVERWGRPYAVLIARTADSDASAVDNYLTEAATALTPLLERTALFEASTERERELVSAAERRLVRVGCDLHDGPLQELVALAEEMRLVRSQVDQVVSDDNRSRVTGRFQDLEARLEALDTGLRQISHSVRATTPVEQPVEDAARAELDALESAVGIETKLVTEGDLDDLTDSQKIVIFRVVQETVSNVRRHSGAKTVSVAIRNTGAFLDVTVTDDGCGFDQRRKVAPGHLGLAGVSERVRLLGGSVEIDSRRGQGTTVRATLPHWRPPGKASRTSVYSVRP